MSTNNIGFYEEISKIIFEISSNTHLISSAGFQRNAKIQALTALQSRLICLHYALTSNSSL